MIRSEFSFLVAALSFSIASPAFAQSHAAHPPVPPQEFQPIRAYVINNNPAHYTINVKSFANITANEDAPAFAVYIVSPMPKLCGDFRYLDLPYIKPSEYERMFDLSRHPDVLKAIQVYGCVVTSNIPQHGMK